MTACMRLVKAPARWAHEYLVERHVLWAADGEGDDVGDVFRGDVRVGLEAVDELAFEQESDVAKLSCARC